MRTRRTWGPAAIAAAVVIVAVALAAGHRDVDPRAGARATASVRNGSFTQLNSRAGLSIFTARNLAPGGSATGEVTVTNAGTLAGSFKLSAADVLDSHGAGAGALSERLRLTVADVTAAASPRTVYTGALAAMPAQALGRLRAGEARTYHFTASLPDGGPPPSATGGDNAYAGSATRVRFLWDASTAPAQVGPAPAPPPATPARDRRAPRLRLWIPRVQRVISRGYLLVRARCDEPCRIDVAGTVRMSDTGRPSRTRPIRGARGGSARATRLRVRIPGRIRRRGRQALLKGRTVTVRLKLTARDHSGNRRLTRRTVRLVRR